MTAARRIRFQGWTVALVATVVLTPGTGGARQRRAADPPRRPVVIALELEDLVTTIKPSAGATARQEMQGFGSGWSGAQLFWGAPAPVNAPIRNWPHLSFSFAVPAPGAYEIVLRHTAAPDFGTFRVFLDGGPLADVDAYSANVTPRSRNFGSRTLSQGNHQITITVFGKAAASSNFFVGLDRLELRTTNTMAADYIGDPGTMTQSARNTGGQPSAGIEAKAIPPELITRAVCLASPETCCPPGAGLTEGCRTVTESLLDIRIRSYVPPRFTAMGDHYPWDTNFLIHNIVSDVTVKGAYSVWPGCRFNLGVAAHTIEDSKALYQKAYQLLEAWLSQWSGGVESAKNWVSEGIATELCSVVDDSKGCRESVASVVKTGINVAIASLGIPPEIPNVQQLREHGIRYIAAQAASYALGDPAMLDKLPLDEATRTLLHKQMYQKGVDILTKELNKVIPASNFNSQNPATWGHLEPAYAPHNAHLYLEVRIKPGMYAKYLHFLAVKPAHKWQPLYLYDANQVYVSTNPIAIPAFIPEDGVILPIELKPHGEATSKEDTAGARIPGVKISRAWLRDKFGIKAGDGLVKAQFNWLPKQHAYYYFSDWDLFYMAPGKASFLLYMMTGKGVMHWEKDWVTLAGSIRDAEIGSKSTMVLPTGQQQLQDYYGRINPAPRCDGKPNMVAGK